MYMCIEPFENVYKEEFARKNLVESEKKGFIRLSSEVKRQQTLLKPFASLVLNSDYSKAFKLNFLHRYIVSYNMTM